LVCCTKKNLATLQWVIVYFSSVLNLLTNAHILGLLFSCFEYIHICSINFDTRWVEATFSQTPLVTLPKKPQEIKIAFGLLHVVIF
jgi:hypothetical protein